MEQEVINIFEISSMVEVNAKEAYLIISRLRKQVSQGVKFGSEHVSGQTIFSLIQVG